MTDISNLTIDKQRIKQTFNAAARTYDDHAALHRHVIDNLLDNLDVICHQPNLILDLGAGTGYCARGLSKRYRRAHTVLLDLSHEMLKVSRQLVPRWRSRKSYVCADAESLPIASDSIDFIFSSLAFQWCNRLDEVFKECHRVLKPNGLLLFSSLGPDTLRELREAWAAVDGSPHINLFIDMHDIGDALVRAGFTSPVLECDRTTVNYDDIYGLIRDLQGLGAVNSMVGRRRGLVTHRQLDRVASHYESLRKNGKLPATYEVIYAHAWRPQPGARAQDGSTVATFPFADIKRLT